MNADKVLDAKGLACPMPIVKTRKEMKDMESGQVLEILATDKGARADLTAWAKSGGHELLEIQEEGNVLKFWIKKG
ncbi:sulfurtransferase TusA family protein [Planomicrobium chinense]|uniref:sulfurtransferase TusA family protein n=1 Tax=Planococcus chinensis TaxID=272917 RepID=UPI001CC64B48|nr:sulfurtransferase TusA family protein [Planococcus chinensis]MBZ5201769.1 sulfurtransferase TusA family protein [Planococcus chinensis]MCP2034781.1 TusA-related sulfurtransferase [Planomicrobium sp. HSC-17F08]